LTQLFILERKRNAVVIIGYEKIAGINLGITLPKLGEAKIFAIGQIER
jgi:hypothetical protein